MACSRAGARHGMRDAVPPCEMHIEAKRGRGAGTAPDAAQTVSDDHPGRFRRAQRPTAPGGDSSGPSRSALAPHRPQRPRASHPGDALGRPRNNPPDEEDPPEQTATTTFTPHAFKTTPEQPSSFGA